jgi:phage-related baseplate assembly protein
MPRLAQEPYTLAGDDHYRRRIWGSPNPLSPHGNAEAYQFWALSALNGALRDVSTVVIRPRLRDAPIILITCLAEAEDPRPSTAQLLEVRKFIAAEARQGLTDVISVMGPKVRETDYRVRVTLFPGPDEATVLDLIRSNLAALVEKQRWLGYDHTRMAVSAACAVTGVRNAEIVSPAVDLLVGADWFVQVTGINVEFAGRTE